MKFFNSLYAHRIIFTIDLYYKCLYDTCIEPKEAYNSPHYTATSAK